MRPIPSKFSPSSYLAASFSGRSSAADRSLATPYTLRQSPRFGVSSISMMSSFSSGYSQISLPSFSSPILSSSGIMPSFVFTRPSSTDEQIMPFDSIPRSFALFISRPLGIMAPDSATGTNCPASTFFAPQTICSVSPPTST